MFKNSMLKISSVLIAILLWVVVATESIILVDEEIPIKFNGLERGYAAVADVANVYIKAKISKDNNDAIINQNIALTIDVADLPIGESSYKLDASMFTVPNDYDIMEIVPKNIVITVDQIVARQVKIEPTFENEVANGFLIDKYVLDPANVVIEGVSAVVNNIKSVKTHPINLSRVNENTSFSIALVKEDGLEELQPSSVGVRVTVKPNIIEHSFSNIYVSCMGLNDSLAMKTLPFIDTVTLTGRSDLIETFLNEASFFVNCGDIKNAGVYTKAINYRVKSKDVKVTGMSPTKIQIEIIKK